MTPVIHSGRCRCAFQASSVRSGFTLVELLVVIAIIGTLVGLLLPAVQSAREAARRMSCSNNMKQVGLAVSGYELARKSYPQGRNLREQFGVSWGFLVLPYVEQSQIFDAYDKTARADDDKNKVAMRTPVSNFFCPSRRSPAADRNFDNNDAPPLKKAAAAGGDYAANAGTYFNYHWESDAATFDPMQGGPMHTYSRVQSRQVTDGLSKTFAIGEKHIPKTTSGSADMMHHDQGDTAFFAADTPLTIFRDTARGIASGPSDLNARKYGSLHPGVTNFTFLDGHVDAISNDTDTTVLRWYCTVGDGNDPTAPTDPGDSTVDP